MNVQSTKQPEMSHSLKSQGSRDDQHKKTSPLSYIQAVVLALLVAQTTSSCTLLSYSKGILKESYNPLEAVMFTEFVKLVMSG